MRGGKVARGGLRWSDRREDFRTEVLGLMKAQVVKNTVIVPTGAKGGFVPKRPPKGDREAILKNGIQCYKTFISGLLDITDNLEVDAVVNAVSVQYLTRPVEVFADVHRVLRPGGVSIVAMSHRCFPTKAVRAFHTLSGRERLDLVARYHELAGGFDEILRLDRSPEGADPLWIVRARKRPEGEPR